MILDYAKELIYIPSCPFRTLTSLLAFVAMILTLV